MKKNVKLLILSLIASLAFTSSLTACDFGGTSNTGSESGNQTTDTGSGDTGSDEQEEVTITLVGTESITRFASKQLTPVITGTEEAPTWTTSNPAVATVDENGLVSALTLGETVITATIGDVKAECTVTVTETDIPHEIEVSLEEVVLFEEASQEVSVSVSYDGEDVAGDYVYTWSLVDGDEDVVSITTAENGKKAVFTGLKVGTVTYEIYTEARGYEAAKEITITVNPNSYALEIAHPSVKPIETGYAVALTLGDSATDNVNFGDAYLAVNGIESNENIDITWTSDNDNAVLDNGTITAYKKGTTVFTGTATYKEETLTVLLTVAVEKGQVAIEDTDMIEVVAAETFTIPASVSVGQVEKVYIGENVLFDKEAEKGSIDGSVVTVDKAGLPAKAEYLGEGQTLAIETNLVVYTMSVDVYTMIINSVEELDSWQEVAAENAIRAGLCIEEQKGLVYSGYFLLGNNINYNKVWKAYKNFSELWALCYSNNSIWVDNNSASGQLKDGAIQEDWGTGKLAGFKGIFDGQGYYIDGLSTESSKTYNAFIVTLGGGTVRNVAFTNMTIGAGCGSVVDRGDGVLENIYVEVNKIHSAGLDNGNIAPTWGLIRGGNGPIHTIINTVIDYSDADLTGVQDAYLGCDIQSEPLQGVYVVGVPASYKGEIWNHKGIERHTLGVYERTVDMFADEKTAATVSSWPTGMWTIGENYVLPTSVVDMMGGDFTISNEETVIPANTSIVLQASKSRAYITYALKEAVDGVSLNGNVISVDKDAVANTAFTVVATSVIDGTTAELTFKTTMPIVELNDTMTVEVVKTETIEIPDAVEGTISKVTIGSCVVYDSENAIGSINGKTVTVGDLPAKAGDLGDGVKMVIVTDKAMYHLSISVYTMIIDNKEEFNSWQAVAADNSVKAGVVIEEQKLAYLTGYFVLGADIEYNDVWTPIIPFAGAANSLYELCNQTNANVKGWINQYGADKVIAVNGWTDPAKLGFHGTFDGKGHIINGMETQGTYSGFNVISGTNSVLKNVAFTNAKVGAKTGFLFNRGSGVLENVFVQVVAMESSDGNDSTTVYGLNGYSAFSVKNVIIDVSQCDFTGKTSLYIADLTAASAEGIYVIGADELPETVTTAGQLAVFYHQSKNDVSGSFATLGDLLADTTHGKNVLSWAGLWSVDDKNQLYFNNKLVIDSLVRTEIATEIKTDPTNGNKATFKNELFTVGSVWNVSVNGGAAQEVTIETEGEYVVAIDPATVSGYLCRVEFASDVAILKYSKVIAVTGISTAEQLFNLAVGGNSTNGLHRNSHTVGNDKLGYYMLVNDIDCSTIELYAGGYSYLQSYFKGVFDGNGYTIKNITLGAGGIFGGLHSATIKNVKMENVVLNALNSNKDEFWGNYTAIFASKAVHTTFTNIDVKISSVSLAVGKPEMLDGLMTSMGSDNCVYTDITIDATGLALEGILGSYFFTNNKATNFVIKAASYSLFGFNGAEATVNGDVWTTCEPMTSYAGITFVDTDEVTA